MGLSTFVAGYFNSVKVNFSSKTNLHILSMHLFWRSKVFKSTSVCIDITSQLDTADKDLKEVLDHGSCTYSYAYCTPDADLTVQVHGISSTQIHTKWSVHPMDYGLLATQCALQTHGVLTWTCIFSPRIPEIFNIYFSPLNGIH